MENELQKDKMDVLAVPSDSPIILSKEEMEHILNKNLSLEELKSCSLVNDRESSLQMMSVPKNHPYVIYNNTSSLESLSDEEKKELDESARRFREINIRNGFEELSDKGNSKGSFVKKLK